jgi:hypothetical protein
MRTDKVADVDVIADAGSDFGPMPERCLDGDLDVLGVDCSI